MQENHLFEYAVIRIVPRVEREEFLNVGVILYCAGLNFLETVYHLNWQRLCAFSEEPAMEELKAYLDAFEQICKGGKDAGPIGRLPISSRFRWLTATRSTIVQTSKVHPGFCIDPRETLLKLHAQLVL
jgi:hypothetical protein